MNCYEEIQETSSLIEEANDTVKYLNNMDKNLVRYIPNEIYLYCTKLDIKLKIFLNKNNRYEVVSC